jgi:4-hydroxybutyrate CoA-transferase
MVNPTRIKNIIPMLDEVEEKRLNLVFGLDDPDDVSKAIANNLRPLLNDRDTIQIGIGKPSKFVIDLGTFDHLKDLSIFTEMGAPGMGFLVKRGIATGRYASLHPGKAVMASLGAMRLAEIRWVHDNPLIEQYSSDYVVNIANIVKHKNMVAINNAVQVDLTGQITCESQFGPRLINGPGGQIEFHIGAFSAPGGKAVSLLPSTWSEGGVSNIVPYMEQGSLVSIPRVFADYIITEHGVAQLAGKTHRERAEELILVAHPDFRAGLEQAAREIC